MLMNYNSACIYLYLKREWCMFPSINYLSKRVVTCCVHSMCPQAGNCWQLWFQGVPGYHPEGPGRGAGQRLRAGAASLPLRDRGGEGRGRGSKDILRGEGRAEHTLNFFLQVNMPNSEIRALCCICEIPMIMMIRSSYSMRIFASICGISQMQRAQCADFGVWHENVMDYF